MKLYAQNWEKAHYTCYNYETIRDKAPFCLSAFFKIKKDRKFLNLVKAITFDFWQTIYIDNQELNIKRDELRALKIWKYLTGIGHNNLRLEAVEQSVQIANDFGLSLWYKGVVISIDNCVSEMGGFLGIPFNDAETHTITEIMGLATLETAPPLAPFIEIQLPELAKKYRLGIVSDTGLTSAKFLRCLLLRDNIISYFTALGFSDELGYSKPNPTIFQLTLQLLGAVSSESVHIGDLIQTDIYGAKRAGMRTIQYTNELGEKYTGKFKAENQSLLPDAVINNFCDIQLVINDW